MPITEGLAAARDAGFSDGRDFWVALRLFNLYRLVIAGVFLVLGLRAELPPGFGAEDGRWITAVAAVYLALAAALQFAIERRLERFERLRNLLALLDLAALGLLMHASGGASGGYGLLLVVAVAGGCVVSGARTAVGLAALASLVVLAETAWGQWAGRYPLGAYTQAGLLGAALFATALLSLTLAGRARRSEALAEERAVALARLSRLNEQVIQRMRSGIVVLTPERRVLLLNAAARRMLAGAEATLDPVLEEVWREWRWRRENRKTPLRLSGGEEVLVAFSALGEAGAGDTLIFLEDAAETQQRVQQIKLASLGRLTMSIAHEIRNPLGAISQAAQLLAESPALAAGDIRLAAIVVEQANRVNDIVRNVMSLGRRNSALAESFLLQPALDALARQLCARHQILASSIVDTSADAALAVRMDPGQFDQVLWNLCENALRYSAREPRLCFAYGLHLASGRPFLDVIDTGPGMSAETAAQAFEPFFTREPDGTGLGLYLARELCEANQASLSLQAHGPEGCRFRILFAHPDRQLLSTP